MDLSSATPMVPATGSQNLPAPKSYAKQDAARGGICFAVGLGPNVLVGVISLVVALAKTIFNSFKSLHYYIAFKQAEKSCLAQKAKIENLTLTGADREEALREYERLQAKLTHSQYQLDGAVAELRDSSRKIAASIFMSIPIAGVFAAGAFLVKTSPHPVAGNTTMKQIFRAFNEHCVYDFKGLGRETLFPLGQTSKTLEEFYGDEDEVRHLFDGQFMKPSEKMAHLGAEQGYVKVDRGDGLEHEIRCQHINTTGNHVDQTVLIFNPPEAVAEEMAEAALLFKKAGWNVMLVTLGGYPGSDQEVLTDEISVIQDVNAVLKLLDNIGVDNIGLYGPSISGTAASMHAINLSDKVKCFVPDRPFTSPTSLVGNTIKNFGGIGKIIPTGLAKALMSVTFPTEIPVPGVTGKDGQPYKTDGFANVDKIANYHGIFRAIGADQDYLMGKDFEEKFGRYRSNFAEILSNACKDGDAAWIEEQGVGHEVGGPFLPYTEKYILEALRLAEDRHL